MTNLSAACAWALLAFATALTAGCGSDEPNAAPTTTIADSTVASSPTTASDPSSTATSADDTRTIDVVYANGQVAGGVRTETVTLGEKVRLRVTSDVAEEVHVHTYDVAADVAAGATAELELTATIPGRHEVEMEEEGKQVMVLEVR